MLSTASVYTAVLGQTHTVLTENPKTLWELACQRWGPQPQLKLLLNSTTGICRFINTLPPRIEYSGKPWLRMTS